MGTHKGHKGTRTLCQTRRPGNIQYASLGKTSDPIPHSTNFLEGHSRLHKWKEALRYGFLYIVAQEKKTPYKKYPENVTQSFCFEALSDLDGRTRTRIQNMQTFLLLLATNNSSIAEANAPFWLHLGWWHTWNWCAFFRPTLPLSILFGPLEKEQDAVVSWCRTARLGNALAACCGITAKLPSTLFPIKIRWRPIPANNITIPKRNYDESIRASTPRIPQVSFQETFTPRLQSSVLP